MDDEPLNTKGMTDSADEFEAAYNDYGQSIYRFLLWRTKDAELSEDLTSSVFEKAWRSRRNFHGGSMRAWLYRIARNMLIDHWRRKHDVPLEDVDTVVEPAASNMDAALDAEREAAHLQTAMRQLPEVMRLVVEARFIKGQSCKETAAQLGLSEANVRVIQYRALRKLRGYLQ